MPTWRCPHCGTPQTETARCWVCRRSSTACGTCRHFRRSVAAQLGYCGLDRRRTPLVGDEIRACWEARRTFPVEAPVGAPLMAHAVAVLDRPGHREFVEVAGDAGRPAASSAPDGDRADPAAILPATDPASVPPARPGD